MKPKPLENAEFRIAYALGFSVINDDFKVPYEEIIEPCTCKFEVLEPEWQEIRPKISWLWGEGDGPDKYEEADIHSNRRYVFAVKKRGGYLALSSNDEPNWKEVYKLYIKKPKKQPEPTFDMSQCEFSNRLKLKNGSMGIYIGNRFGKGETHGVLLKDGGHLIVDNRGRVASGSYEDGFDVIGFWGDGE